MYILSGAISATESESNRENQNVCIFFRLRLWLCRLRSSVWKPVCRTTSISGRINQSQCSFLRLMVGSFFFSVPICFRHGQPGLRWSRKRTLFLYLIDIKKLFSSDYDSKSDSVATESQPLVIVSRNYETKHITSTRCKQKCLTDVSNNLPFSGAGNWRRCADRNPLYEK